MKKLYFITLLSCLGGLTAQAQVGAGGFPLSASVRDYVTIANKHVILQKPDYERLALEDAQAANAVKMYRVGTTIPADLDFQKTGSWTYLADGTRIWKLSVEIPEAQAITLYYDQFHLPKGVRLFVSNANGRQILGAYTADHNVADGRFSNEPVQGSVVNIEMDIDPNVNVSDIQYRIKNAGALYRGLDNDVAQYSSTQIDPVNPPVIGQSAQCHVNAICPAANDYADERTGVARILISPDDQFSDIGFCSGTLINNTRNFGTTCRPLFITASHCDGANQRTNAHFQYWQFRFNFKSTNCDGTGLPNATTAPTLTGGAKFVSRSNYPSMAGSPDHPSLVQDFLLLELNDNLSPVSNAHLAGWSRKAGYSVAEMEDEYNYFIGMHHPGGDLMKLSAALEVAGNGTFNQTAVSNTHWNINTLTGGTAGGSSGSGLFDVYGRIIGVLSGGPDAACNLDGKDFGVSSQYSKIPVGWENPFDQTNFPAFAGAQSRLKDALDPSGSNVMTVETVPVSNCTNAVGIRGLDQMDNSAFQVYPNPSADGNITIQFNFATPKNASIVIYDVLGKVVSKTSVNQVTNNSYKMSIDHAANGVYMVNVLVDNSQLTKRIVINKQ
jgi:hypothetical protein